VELGAQGIVFGRRGVHLRHGREFKQFTFHAYRWPDFYDNWMDPAKNAHWAYGIYSEQGLYPWSCRWAAC